MSKITKMWLIAAASLILIGVIIFGGVMTVLKWDLSKLSTVKYETTEHKISESYKNISINTDVANIVFVPSESGESTVICHESVKAKHSVTVADATLVIEVKDTRKWYEYIGINFGSPKITVYLPRDEYGKLSVTSDTGNMEIPKDFNFESIDILTTTGIVKNSASASEGVNIKTTTGSIKIDGISAKSLDLSATTGSVCVFDVKINGGIKVKVSTGEAELTDVTCEAITSDGNTGNVLLKNVIALKKIDIKRSTGKITFDSCDAAEILVKTDTGDVTGTLLSEKVFITHTDTGKISVPKSAKGGKCEITTDTGDIKLQIK